MRAIIKEGQFLDQETADVMWEFLKELPECGRMLEIGTGKGHSAKAFSIMKPNWIIYTIDGFGLYGGEFEIGGIFKHEKADKAIRETSDYLKDCNNVIQLLGDSNNLCWELPICAVYIDGTHSYEAVKKDFEAVINNLIDGGIVLFHDYHREDYGVRKFVNELIEFGSWELLYGHKMAVIKRK